MTSGPYARSSFWQSVTPGQRFATEPPWSTPVRRFASALRKLGPWALVHLVFLSLALGTAWTVGTAVAPGQTSSLPLAAALVGEVALAFSISAVHVRARLSRR